MLLNEFAAIGFGLSFLAYAVLCLRLTSRSGPGILSRALWIAASVMMLWSLTQGLSVVGLLDSQLLVKSSVFLRNIAWLIVLVLTVTELRGEEWGGRFSESAAFTTGLILLLLTVPLLLGHITDASINILNFFGLVSAAIAIGLSEQVLRNTGTDQGPSAKYIAIALGGIFAIDFVSYIPVHFLREKSASFDAARGLASAIFALPLIVVAGQPLMKIGKEGGRQRYVYYLFSIITLAAVLLILFTAEYYVQKLEGESQTAFWLLVIIIFTSLIILSLMSERLRGRIRVFLTKSFLPYKYDYRKEWLRFIGTLSENQTAENPYATSVRAIARIIGSPGGMVWLLDSESKQYSAVAAWPSQSVPDKEFDETDELVAFLRNKHWVIDLSERYRYPALYDGLEVDSWFINDESWWLIIPLLFGEELYGFVALTRPKVVSSLNFEDHDLLRTVGRHVATHLKQVESDKQLAQAQQFGAYHRLSAFLMHDLNNLVAQQSLVVQNAERHRHDPRFIDDAIATIANSVSRMNRLLAQFSRAPDQPSTRDVDVLGVLRTALERSNHREPRAKFECDLAANGNKLLVSADADRLSGVLEHLVRNAQEATADTGQVVVRVAGERSSVLIEVRDSGSGMSDEFIRQRLFKPFDSTKGSEGMGIGAYQSREYIRMIGGELKVISSPGLGTTFRIRLPVVNRRAKRRQ